MIFFFNSFFTFAVAETILVMEQSRRPLERVTVFPDMLNFLITFVKDKINLKSQYATQYILKISNLAKQFDRSKCMIYRIEADAGPARPPLLNSDQKPNFIF